MGIVWHDTAMTTFGEYDFAGADLVVDRIVIGSLAAAERYDATGAEVGPEDVNPEIFDTGINLNQGGPILDVSVTIPQPDAVRRASEIFFYSGANIMAVWANADGDIFTQATNQQALILLSYQYTRGNAPGVITVQVVVMLPDATTEERGLVELATDAEAQAAIEGADPDAAIEGNVVTLQNLYANRDKFGRPHIAQTTVPSADQIRDAEVGTIWMVYEI